MIRTSTFLLTVAIVAASCGSSEASEPATTTTTAPTTTDATTTTELATTTTTEAATTTTAEATTTTEDVPFVAEGPDQAEIVQNWDLTFGIGPFEERAAALEDSAALETTIDSYVAAVNNFGSIELPVTAITVNGESATVTFDVLGNGATMAADLTGEMIQVDGAWIVSRDSFCDAMKLARQSCPTDG